MGVGQELGGAGAGTPHLMGATAVAVLEVWEIPGNPGDSTLLCKMSWFLNVSNQFRIKKQLLVGHTTWGSPVCDSFYRFSGDVKALG